MKTVSIIAATFYGNRGAEAMLSTTIGKLKESFGEDINFNVFTYYPERDRGLVSDKSVTCYSSTPLYLVAVLFPCAVLFRLFSLLRLSAVQRVFPESVKSLAKSKLLICLAGVSFVQGRTKFIPFNIATIWPAMVLGVPVVKFAQALGPFSERWNRWSAKLFLPRCRQIFTRGEVTQRNLEALMPEGKNYQRADDLAFLFSPEYCLSRAEENVEEPLGRLQAFRRDGRIIVGFCPSVVLAKRATKSGWNYEQRMSDLVTRIVSEGHVVALYPNATKAFDMDDTHNNDLPLLDDIMGCLDGETKSNVVLFSGNYNAAQIHSVIRNCDVNAVSRFHAMVASLSVGIPPMVIGWSHKYLEVMARFDQEDMVFDYNQGDLEAVADCLATLVSEREQRAAKIQSLLGQVRDLASRQVDYAIHLLQ